MIVMILCALNLQFMTMEKILILPTNLCALRVLQGYPQFCLYPICIPIMLSRHLKMAFTIIVNIVPTYL